MPMQAKLGLNAAVALKLHRARQGVASSDRCRSSSVQYTGAILTSLVLQSSRPTQRNFLRSRFRPAFASRYVPILTVSLSTYWKPASSPKAGLPPPPWISGDRIRLAQVMLPLASAGYHVLAPEHERLWSHDRLDDSYDGDVFPFRHTIW